MTTFTLTVSSDGLGLGVLAGCAVQIDRKRAVMAEQYPPVDVLYLMRSATDEDGVVAFDLKPDDETTYHVCTLWDMNGVVVFKQSFSMPPDACPLHDLSEAVIGASIQFQNQGVNVGTPPTTQTINFTGSSVNATFSGETLTVTIDDRQYIDQAVSTAVSSLVDSAPGTLDTLNELAAALGDDPNFATSTATALANRVRADAAQSFSATEKRQARKNIGIERQSVTFSTALLAPMARETGSVEMATAFGILTITTNHPARVRLYDTAAHCAIDASRLVGRYPEDNAGCLFEFVTTSSMLSSSIPRAVNGFNNEYPVTTSIAYVVENNDIVDRSITTTIGFMPAE